MPKDPRDKIRNPDCLLCPLQEEAEHVCLMGSGPMPSKVMIVGEAPGAREDESHKAFVGPAGKELDKFLAKAGLDRDECYITNVAKCRPPGNRTPDRKEIKTCVSAYLYPEIEAVGPEFILLLGNSALQGVVGRSGITKHRGKVYEVGGTKILATFHPAAVLRNPRYRAEVEADVQRFGRLVRGEKSTSTTRTRIIRNTKQLRWLIRQLMQAKEISFDIETTGLEEWVDDAKIVSLGFTWETGSAAVVPISHRNSPWKDPLRLLAALKPCLERSGVRYVAHNGKFDCRWLARFGIFVPLKFDTLLAAHMLDENRSKGLKVLSQVILGVDAYDIGEDVRDAYNAPLKRLCIYNGKDTDYTLRLSHIFKKELLEEPRVARVYAKLMVPASNALTRAERIGLWVDEGRLRKRTKKVQKKVDRLYEQMIDKHGAPEGINLNSPQQVAAWFYGELDLPIIEETGTGAPSTREAVLLRLAHQHSAPAALLEYRGYAKWLSTYLGPWDERRDSKSRLHTNYKLFGTVTGRLSSEHPNLQQVPRNPFIRGILGAPPGWQFLEADYSQIELRIAAMLSGCKRMLRAYHVGEDLHLQTAVRMTGKLPEDILPEERKKGKSQNFGFVYGMGPNKFQEYAWEKYQLEVSDDEAEAAYRTFHDTYPELKRWYGRQIRLAHRYKRVSAPTGRVRHLPDIDSNDRYAQAEAERQAINSPVQALATDFMLGSMVQLNDQLPQGQARLVGTVHDALLFEVRDDFVDEAAAQIKAVMEDMDWVKRNFGCDITVPIEAEVKIGQHWGEGTVWAK